MIYVANSQHKDYFNLQRRPGLQSVQVVAGRQRAAAVSSAAIASHCSADGRQKSRRRARNGGGATARRGAAFAARRDFEHALADLTRACELDPNNAEYLLSARCCSLAEQRSRLGAGGFQSSARAQIGLRARVDESRRVTHSKQGDLRLQKPTSIRSIGPQPKRRISDMNWRSSTSAPTS